MSDRMIRSMTGYGRGERQTGGLLVTVEVRSVNHRFLDLRMKIPAEATDMESGLRRRVARQVGRGRVELSINLRREKGAGDVRVNRSLVQGYVAAAREIRDETGIVGDVDLSLVLQLPGAVRVEAERARLTRTEAAAVTGAVDDALDALVAMRGREGSVLGRDLTKRLEAIRRGAAGIRRRAQGLAGRRSARLRKRVRELAGGVEVDPARLAQEVAILADRADVEEELVRMEAHLDAMKRLLGRKTGPRGKELDFVTQELHRETNTINSKAADLPITRAALEIKSEIEKIREQVQNIE